MTKKKRHKTAVGRLRKNVSVALSSVLLLCALALLDRYAARQLPLGRTVSGAAVSDSEKYHGRSFEVVKVIDGDTIDIDVPDAKSKHTTVRLLGVDTPETKSRFTDIMYYGPQASEATKKLVLNRPVTVIIDPASKTRDRYGRLIAYIGMEDGITLNQRLVEDGFAYADLRFPHTHFEKYLLLQEDAMNNNRGLWKEVKFEQLPAWLRREKPDILKGR